jgi:large subunit ribosomal protein L22
VVALAGKFSPAASSLQWQSYSTGNVKSTEDLFNQIYEAPEEAKPQPQAGVKGGAATSVQKGTTGSKVALTRKSAPTRANGEVVAHKRSIRTSMKKLQPLTRLIIKKKLDWAIEQMELSHKRVARIVKSHLTCARNNAVHNHGLDPSKLIVSRIVLGRDTVLKRVLPHSKGRAGIIDIPHTHMSIYVREKTAQDAKKGPILSPKWARATLALKERHQQFSRRLAHDIRVGKVKVKVPVPVQASS